MLDEWYKNKFIIVKLSPFPLPNTCWRQRLPLSLILNSRHSYVVTRYHIWMLPFSCQIWYLILHSIAILCHLSRFTLFWVDYYRKISTQFYLPIISFLVFLVTVPFSTSCLIWFGSSPLSHPSWVFLKQPYLVLCHPSLFIYFFFVYCFHFFI